MGFERREHFCWSRKLCLVSMRGGKNMPLTGTEMPTVLASMAFMALQGLAPTHWAPQWL